MLNDDDEFDASPQAEDSSGQPKPAVVAPAAPPQKKFWFPKSSKCTCCEGHKLACPCIKDDVTACLQCAANYANSVKPVVPVAAVAAQPAPTSAAATTTANTEVKEKKKFYTSNFNKGKDRYIMLLPIIHPPISLHYL